MKRLVLLVLLVSVRIGIAPARAQTSFRPDRNLNAQIEAIQATITRLQLERLALLQELKPRAKKLRDISARVAALRHRLAQLERERRTQPGPYTPPQIILCGAQHSFVRRR